MLNSQAVPLKKQFQLMVHRPLVVSEVQKVGDHCLKGAMSGHTLTLPELKHWGSGLKGTRGIHGGTELTGIRVRTGLVAFSQT